MHISDEHIFSTTRPVSRSQVEHCTRTMSTTAPLFVKSNFHVMKPSSLPSETIHKHYTSVLMNIKWTDKITNGELWRNTEQKPVEIQIKRRKWNWIGHTLRKEAGAIGPPLWSSGQSFWLQIQRSRVRFPALLDFLSSSGSGTGSTQHREVN